jgi:hypothetical protein
MTLKSDHTQSKFHEGQKVRVVVGIKDPDYGFPIEGWSGTIEEVLSVEDDSGARLYSIVWNSESLDSMSRALRRKCDKDNLDVTRMTLAENDLESA